MTRSKGERGKGGRCKEEPSRRENEYLLIQSDRRETTAVLGDTRFMSDWNVYDTWLEGKINNNGKIQPFSDAASLAVVVLRCICSLGTAAVINNRDSATLLEA